jgi:thioredoxin
MTNRNVLNAMIDITGGDFEKEVLECQLPVIACFTNKRCQSCVPACYFFDKLAGEYDGAVKFVRLDIGTSIELVTKYHINVVPTFIYFRNSQPFERLVGFQEQKSLRIFIDSNTN